MDVPIIRLNAENGFSLKTSVIEGGITLARGANFGQTTIMNRSSPIVTFSEGQNPIVTIGFKFVNLLGKNSNEVFEVIDSLYSLTLPIIAGIKPPPLCTLNVGGGKFKALTDFKCVAQQFDSSPYGEVLQQTDNQYSPMEGVCTVTFLGIEQQNKSVEDFLAAEDYEQLQFTTQGW